MVVCIIILRMEKYKLLERIAKSKWYSFYRAEDKSSRQPVTIKKLHRQANWEEVLKSRTVTLMNNSPVKEVPSIKEIVKDEGAFCCVFDNLERNLEGVIREELQKDEIFKLARALIQLVVHLHEHSILPREIRPLALFTPHNYLTLKLAHIELYPASDLTKLDLTQLQDLRYSPPEVVLTSCEPDERSTVFAAGLLISELILGKPLLTANNKLNYMYEICRLFPEEGAAAVSQTQSRLSAVKEEERFESVLGQYEFSNEFISLLREMLRVDRGQRVALGQLLQAFDLIVANEEEFLKKKREKTIEADISIKPNSSQAPINNQILQVEIELDFEKKPTLSLPPTFKPTLSTLPTEKNVDDDAVQPIIIKKSTKPQEGQGSSMPVPIAVGGTKQSRTTKQQTISSTRRPQLTNYAMNESSHLGVKLGFHPTLFSDNDNDL